MQAVGIIANCQREAAVACAADLSRFLRERDIRVQLAEELALSLGEPPPAGGDPAVGATNLVVAVGGDGTLLAANRLASPHGTPILGIHSGGPASFGFLTETVPTCAVQALEAVLRGDFRIEARLMMSVRVSRAGEDVANLHALNDLVIRGQARMSRLRIQVADTYIATYAADGIIVATPTGSTAYNLAAGGPLVHPAIEALVLTPICPHTLNVRSLLVGVTDTIHVVLESGERDLTQLTVDGQISFALEPQDQLYFSRSALQGRFVSLDGANFYKKVQTRLRLGERFGN